MADLIARQGTRLDPDQIWHLDHSRRAFRVRLSFPSDHPAFCTEGATVDRCITIVRIADMTRLIVTAISQLAPESWTDSDAYASRRWCLVNQGRRRAGQPTL